MEKLAALGGTVIGLEYDHERAAEARTRLLVVYWMKRRNIGIPLWRGTDSPFCCKIMRKGKASNFTNVSNLFREIRAIRGEKDGNLPVAAKV